MKSFQRTKRWLLISTAFVVILWAVSYPWTATEPVVHGRTATDWLDRMALFDEIRNRDQTGQSSFQSRRSPEQVTKDKALRALCSLGSKVIPTLEKRIIEPPLPKPEPPLAKLQSFVVRQWHRFRSGAALAAAPPPSDYPSYQEARKIAAGFTYLALGTNAGAGFLPLIESYALASKDSVNARASFGIHTVMWAAKTGLPERTNEIISGITAGLNHTNAMCRQAAANATRAFPGRIPLWKDRLLQMSREESNAEVRLAALWALGTTAPHDTDVLQMEIATLEDRSNPILLRSFAASSIGLAGTNASHALPLLKSMLGETNSHFLQSTRQAIRHIEEARPYVVAD